MSTYLRVPPCSGDFTCIHSAPPGPQAPLAPAAEHHRPLPPHPVRRTVPKSQCALIVQAWAPPTNRVHVGTALCWAPWGIAGLSNNGSARISLREHSTVLSVAWGQSYTSSPHR